MGFGLYSVAPIPLTLSQLSVILPVGTVAKITDYGGTIAESDGVRWRLDKLYLNWSAKPPANAVPIGTEICILDLNNTNFFSDGTNWRPNGKQVIYHKNGLVASPLATLSGVTAGLFAIPQVLIPAGMIIPNSKIEVQYFANKTNANGSLGWNMQLGTTESTSDSNLSSMYEGASAWDVMVYCAARFSSDPTKFLAIPSIGDTTNTNAASLLYDRTTNINTAANMYVTIGIVSANVLDVFSLTSVRVSYEA